MRAEQRRARSRAFRGLALTFVFSFVNLAGILFTAMSVGALGDWERWQFIGLFGLVEAGSGAASVVLPNIWRLPVAEQQTSRRTSVRLAASALLLPHWGALARCLAGALMLTFAVYRSDAALLPLLAMVPALALAVLSVFMLVARCGVACPDLDVVQLTLTWGGKTHELPGISLGASAVQFLLATVTIPIAQVAWPQLLYGDGASPWITLLCLTAASLLLAGAALWAWRDRLAWQAEGEQQQEAEANA